MPEKQAMMAFRSQQSHTAETAGSYGQNNSEPWKLS